MFKRKALGHALQARLPASFRHRFGSTDRALVTLVTRSPMFSDLDMCWGPKKGRRKAEELPLVCGHLSLLGPETHISGLERSETELCCELTIVPTHIHS